MRKAGRRRVMIVHTLCLGVLCLWGIASAAEGAAPQASPVQQRIETLLARVGLGADGSTAFLQACRLIARTRGEGLVTDRELEDIAESLRHVPEPVKDKDAILAKFVQDKLTETEGTETAGAQGGDWDYELMRVLAGRFGEGVTLEQAIRLGLASELAMRYREADDPLRELAVLSVAREASPKNQEVYFRLTHDMVRAALAAGNLPLAMLIAREYFVVYDCRLHSKGRDHLLWSMIAEKAAEEGDHAVAFHCARLAFVFQEAQFKDDELMLSKAFAHLGPGMRRLFAAPWPSEEERGDAWFNAISEAWRGVPTAETGKEMRGFAAPRAERTGQGEGGRIALARFHMLLGDDKAAVEALLGQEAATVSADEWRFLCRVLLVVSGDPRILEPASKQNIPLNLPVPVAQRLKRLIGDRYPSDEYAASLKDRFVTAALLGAQAGLQEAVGETPKGHVLRLFAEHAAEAQKAGDRAEAVRALRAIALLAPAGEGDVHKIDAQEKRNILASFLVGATGATEPASIVDEMMGTFPVETPQEQAAEFLRYARLYERGAHVQAFQFHAAHYLYRKEEFTGALSVLDNYEVKDAKKHLLRGLCYVRTDDPEKAKEQLAVVVKEFPDSPQVEQALFVTGWCDLIAGSKEQAAKAFHQLLEQYPAGSYAEKARKFLEGIEPPEDK